MPVIGELLAERSITVNAVMGDNGAVPRGEPQMRPYGVADRSFGVTKPPFARLGWSHLRVRKLVTAKLKSHGIVRREVVPGTSVS